VSNFSTVNLTKLLRTPTTTVTPSVNQVELHPLCQQQQLLDYCKEKGIVCTAYCPLARGKELSINIFEHPAVKDVADKHGINTSQAILSWGVWRGTPVLPKSANPDRLRANLAIVALSDDDGNKISAIGAGKTERIVADPGKKYNVTVFHDDA
jgi:glycerol 2-dehydrogenase (NADP+)